LDLYVALRASGEIWPLLTDFRSASVGSLGYARKMPKMKHDSVGALSCWRAERKGGGPSSWHRRTGGMEGQNRARQTTVCRLLLDLWDDFRLGTNRVGDRASSSVPACLVC
jgi:hypothetical protein